MIKTGYTLAPEEMNSNLQEWCRRIAQTTNGIMAGRTNNTNEITLVANSPQTVVNLPKGMLAEGSLIIFDPMTSSAASELYGGNMYVPESERDVKNGRFTIIHSNNAQEERKFRYAIIG